MVLKKKKKENENEAKNLLKIQYFLPNRKLKPSKLPINLSSYRRAPDRPNYDLPAHSNESKRLRTFQSSFRHFISFTVKLKRL